MTSTPNPAAEQNVFHIFENETPRIERSRALNVILKRLGVDEPTYEDIATVTRWADAHVTGGLAALRAHGLLSEGAPSEEHYHIWSEVPCKPGECRMGEPQPSEEQIEEAHAAGMDAVDWDMVREGKGDPAEAASIAVRAALTAAGVAPQEPSKPKQVHEPDEHRVYCVRCGGGWPCQPTPSPDREKRGGEGVPIIECVEGFTKPDDLTRMTVLLMTAWGKSDPRSKVSQYPASYIATFVDMARAVLAAPVAVDEAKLAEVLWEHAFTHRWQCACGQAFPDYGSRSRHPRHVIDHLASVVAEWLAGGER